MTQERKGALIYSAVGPRWVGGSETARNAWSEAIQKTGRKVDWVVPEYSCDDRGGRVPDGVDVLTIKTGKSKFGRLLSSPSGLLSMQEIVSKNNPERIIINGVSIYDGLYVLGLIRLGMGNRLVDVYHADPNLSVETRRGLKKFLAEKAVGIRASISKAVGDAGGQIVAVSNYVAEKLRERNVEKTVVCYPPMNLDDDCPARSKREKPVNGDGMAVLNVSRYSSEKGLGFYGDLAKRSAKLKLPIEFSLVGASSDKQYQRTYEEENKGWIIFKGQKTGRELCSEYGKCDVFIMPSPNEAFGLTTVEALQHGKPVVAGYRAVDEIFEKSNSGVKPGLKLSATSGEQAISEALQFIMNLRDNPSLKEVYAQAAIGVANSFDPRVVADDFVKKIF